MCSKNLLLILSILLTCILFSASSQSSKDIQSYIQKGEYEKAIPILKEALKKNPTDTNLKKALFLCYFQLGLKKYEANELATAAEHFHNALNIDPSSIPARQNLALTLLRLGNLSEAKRVIEEGLNTTPPDRNLLLILAQIYQKEGSTEKVISTLEEIHKNYPNDRETGLILASIYYSQMKLQEARRIYQDLEKAYPQDTQIILRVAKTYEDEQKWDDAIAQYEKILKIEPKNIEVYRMIARLYERENNIDKAIEVYERAIKSVPEAGNLYFWLGELYEKKGDTDSALANYKKATDLSVEHPLPYYKLALQEKDPNQKDQLLKQAVNKGVRLLEQLEQRLLLNIGEKTSLENLRGSLELAEEIEKLEKTLRSALDAYLFPPGSETSEKAEKDLQSLLKRYPQSRILLEYTGAILEKKEQWDRALEVWTKILQRNARVERAHLGMGRAYEAKGEWEKARLAYRRALELDEKDEDAYNGLVRMSEKTGKLGELVEEWQRKARFPSYRRNLLFLTRLEQLLRKVGKEDEADKIKKQIDELKITD
ncbi:tetratricopeptide repeat protein [bacterium]|nr:tetratricopeptide repeat protein [bacterium]